MSSLTNRVSIKRTMEREGAVLSGIEKEVFDVVKSDDTLFLMEEVALMERYYFELNKSKLSTFAKYVELGEKMDFKDVLLKISELSVKGQNEGVYDGISFISDTIMSFLVEIIDEAYNENDEPLSIDKRDDFIQKTSIQTTNHGVMSLKMMFVSFYCKTAGINWSI